MENNITNSKDSHINLGNIDIYKYPEENKTSIYLPIPFKAELWGERSLDGCKEAILDDLENTIGTLFDITQFFSQLVADGHTDTPKAIGEYILALARLGAGFPIAIETARVEFRHYQKQQIEVKENKPLETVEPKPRRKIAGIDDDYEYLDFDFSLLETVDIPDLAAALSAILEHPLLPKAMHDGVINGMNSVRDTLTDEQLQTLTDDEGDSLYIGELIEFDEKNRVAAKSKPLDLSQSSPEAISQSLVDLMSNPNLPDNIRACLEVELPNVQKGE